MGSVVLDVLKGAGVFLIMLICLMFQGCTAVFRPKTPSQTFRVSVSERVESPEKIRLSNGRNNIVSYGEVDEPVLNAVVSDSLGEIVGQGRIAPLTVTAQHRNVAERNGKIDLGFDINVPKDLLKPDRQIRINPFLVWENGGSSLDRLFVTGKGYRDSQNRGYEKYLKFYSSIIPDSVDFLKAFGYLGLLKYFMDRNIEERPEGEYGVTSEEAADYYIRLYLVKANRRRKERLEEVFRKCVKDPLDRLGVRLDTVLDNPYGGLTYRYVQTVDAKPGMHRLKLSFTGSLHTYGNTLYSFDCPDTVTYYVSSLSQLADTSERYIEKTLARDVSVSTIAFIEFEKGSWLVDSLLGNNALELRRLKADFDSISLNKTFLADSVVICASCSPEGSYGFNQDLSRKRAESVMALFSGYGKSSGMGKTLFRTEYVPENWELLRDYVLRDSTLRDKQSVLDVFSEEDPDKREVMLSKCSDYPYIRASIYPLLRKIDFRFYLHRRIYDIVQEKADIDRSYMDGLKALKDLDFKTALEKLAPYSDFNSAIAYMCMDYNASALNILEKQEKTPQTEYLMALCYKRLGNLAKARTHFLSSVGMDRKMFYRASLDPEMNVLMEDVDIETLGQTYFKNY